MILYPSITVDLYKPYPLVILEVPQYNIGRGALVTLTAGGSVAIPTDETIETYALKPDGTKVYNTAILAGNQVQINFSEQMTAVDGILQCELQMIDALGHSITTPIFAVRILPSNIDAEAITSSDDFQALVDALAQVQGFDQVKQSIGTLSELTTTAKNNLVAALNELNQKMEWKFMGSGNAIQIPAGAKDINVCVTFKPGQVASSVIPNRNQRVDFGFYYTPSANGSACVNIANSVLTLVQAFNGGNDAKTTVQMNAYYR